MLWATMTHNDPLWPTVTQNLVSCFALTKNKVLGHFIFLNFVSRKYLFGKNLVPKLETVLFLKKLDIKGYSRLLILNSIIVFLNFVPKLPFLSKCGPENLEIDTKRCSQVLIPNLTIVFLSSVPKIPFLGIFSL